MENDKHNNNDHVDKNGGTGDGHSDAGEEIPLTPELQELLDTRIHETDDNPDLRILWEDVRDRALSRLRR